MFTCPVAARRPSRLALVVIAAAGAVLAGACVVSTGDRASVGRADQDATPGTDALDRSDVDLPSPILAVGDSVLALIADDLTERIDARLVVDGVDCRRIDAPIQGPCGSVPAGTTVTSGLDAIGDAVDEMTARGTPPAAGIAVLANNSSLLAVDLDAAMDAFGPVARVFWVNTRIDGFGRQDPNNEALAALARRDDRVVVVDWFAASDGRAWRSDHVHPNDVGQTVLADLVADAVACGCPT